MRCPRFVFLGLLSLAVGSEARGWKGEESLHEAVACTADDQGAVADEVDAAYGIGVGGQGAHDAGGADVPEEDGFVVGAADQHVAFGGEGDGVDVVVVAEERYRVCFPLH